MVVVDASAALAWLLESQSTAASEKFLARSTEFWLIAPDIFLWEVHNAMLTVERRGRLPSGAHLRASSLIEQYAIKIATPFTAEEVSVQAEIARSLGLSLFDSAYLTLAQDLSCDLASRDGNLIKVATENGVFCYDLRDVGTHMTDPEVQIFLDGAVGRITLNRPSALHALTTNMCVLITDALVTWLDNPIVKLVMIDHSGERGFCAGGDIRMLAESGAGDGVAARKFFFIEYRLNHLLFEYPKPVIVIMDGVTMGGGVGLAAPARYRVATERTTYAMPETGIGLFPDVGGGWFLPRMPGHIGLWLALTGARIKAADCELVGIATDFIESGKIAEFKAAVVADPAAVETILTEFEGDAGRPPLATHQDEIDRLFGAADVEKIAAGLERANTDWARDQLRVLATKSPQTLKVAFRQLALGGVAKSFAENMAMEYAIGARVVQRHDFLEGVRAVIVDKDNAPKWNPPRLEDVTEVMLDEIFSPLPSAEAWSPLIGL